MIVRMLSPIDPRCTGMCGALAISAPSASNNAQEKSSRSLMLTDVAVDCSATPISSAIAMNRLLKISSRTGSTAVPMAWPRSSGTARVSTSVAVVGAHRLPAGLDHRRRGGFEDQRGAVDRLAGAKLVAMVGGPAAASIGLAPAPAGTRALDAPTGDCLDGQRIDHRLGHRRSRSAGGAARRTPRASSPARPARPRAWCRFPARAAARGGGGRSARARSLARRGPARAASSSSTSAAEKSSPSGRSQLASRIAFTSARPMP